jgi:hypothetical protein
MKTIKKIDFFYFQRKIYLKKEISNILIVLINYLKLIQFFIVL